MEGHERGTPELEDGAKGKLELPSAAMIMLGTSLLVEETKGKPELPLEAKVTPEVMDADDEPEEVTDEEPEEVTFIKKGKNGQKITTHKVFDNGKVTVRTYEDEELTSCTVDGVEQVLPARKETTAANKKEKELPDSRTDLESGAPPVNEQSRKTLPSQQDQLEREPMKTTCTWCNKEVITSVKSAFNKYGITWIIYSLFFWPYFLFLMCIGAFKTYTHKCPQCAKILTQFTPKLNASARAGIIYAICNHVFILGVFACFHFGWISFQIKIGH